MAAGLIALDWGTSSLRAYLMRGARVVDQRHADAGIQSLAAEGQAGFERAFDAISGDWRQREPALPVVACGMVGSAQGWLEVPYVDCPADASALSRALKALRTASGATLHIVGGVRFDDASGVPDVMRGEETQVFGALRHDPAWARAAWFVLPGTHSKWVRVRNARIESLATYMTGELFAVLRRHSILGRLMAGDHDDPAAPSDAFLRGVAHARRGGSTGELLHSLFSVRTLGLTQRLAPAQAADYLSGLLIGSELSAAIAAAADAPLVLVGESALCRRYALALAAFERPPAATLHNTAPDGLWALAAACRLIDAST